MTIPTIVDTTPDDAPKAIILSQTAYDAIKDVTIIAIPALDTAYISLSGVFHLLYSTQILGVSAVLVFLLGILLKISNVQFKAAAKVAVAKAVAASVVASTQNQTSDVGNTADSTPAPVAVQTVQPTPTYPAPTGLPTDLTGQSVAGVPGVAINTSAGPETPGTVSSQ